MIKPLRILPCVLSIALLLTACGGEAPLSNDGVRASAGSSGSGYWERWLTDIPNGPFEKAGSESFALEHNGYSIEIAIDIWTGARGTGEFMLHPANSQIPLRAYDSTHCVIPFVVTTTTTTADASFTTDYKISSRMRQYYSEGIAQAPEGSGGDYNNEAMHSIDLSYLEKQIERNEESLAKKEARQSPLDGEAISQSCAALVDRCWGESLSRQMTGTTSGEEQTVLGCFVIKDYYSPNHPNGNTDMLSDIGACLWLEASVEGSSPERFTIIMLGK